MGSGEREIPPHRIQVVEVRIALEAFRRLAVWESLVSHDYAGFYAVFLDEVGICGHIEHVSGIALRTDRFLLFQIECVDYGYVATFLRPGLSGKSEMVFTPLSSLLSVPSTSRWCPARLPV